MLQHMYLKDVAVICMKVASPIHTNDCQGRPFGWTTYKYTALMKFQDSLGMSNAHDYLLT